MVFSHDFLKVPSTPVHPRADTKSRVNRNGIVSDVGRHFPCSNAIPIELNKSLMNEPYVVEFPLKL